MTTIDPIANTRIAPKTSVEKELEELYRKFVTPHQPLVRLVQATTTTVPSLEDGGKAFGPPLNLDELLDKMTKDSGSITRGFNTILQLPFLYSISVRDPEAPEDQKIDLQTMITRMLKKYQAFQLLTVPFARSLYTYSLNQLVMIPNINKPSGLTLEKFLELFSSVAQQYQNDVNDISLKTLQFSQEWLLAVDSIIQALNETTDGKKVVDESEEEKKKDNINSVLASLGVIAFTIASFITNLNIITQTWKTIVTNLGTVAAQKDMWNSFVNMSDTFEAFVRIVVGAWTKVRDNVLIYIKVVSDSNPVLN